MTKSLKILAFAAYYHPFRGGYIESIHEWAKRLHALGHVVTVVTCNVTNSPDEESLEGVRIIRLPAWHLLNGTYPLIKFSKKTQAILKKLKEEQYDIVSTQTRFFITSFLGTYFAHKNRIHHLHTERGATHSVVDKKWIGLASRIIDHTLGHYVVRHARTSIGVSKAACEFLKHLGAQNIICIPNGVERIESLTPEEKNQQRHKQGFHEEDTILLFVGRIIYSKGVQDVLAILPDLIMAHPSLKLVIVGEGPYRKALETMVYRMGLGRQIYFVGDQPFEIVKEWLQIADCMVNPSHSEGLPRSVLEGAAAGLPIVATDTGGTSEIIQDRVSGKLVPVQNNKALKEALLDILRHQNEARNYGEKAREHVQTKLNWDSAMRAYIDLVEQFI